MGAESATSSKQCWRALECGAIGKQNLGKENGQCGIGATQQGRITAEQM